MTVHLSLIQDTFQISPIRCLCCVASRQGPFCSLHVTLAVLSVLPCSPSPRIAITLVATQTPALPHFLLRLAGEPAKALV